MAYGLWLIISNLRILYEINKMVEDKWKISDIKKLSIALAR